MWSWGKELESIARAEGGKKGLCVISFWTGEKCVSNQKDEQNRASLSTSSPPPSPVPPPAPLFCSLLHQPSLVGRLEGLRLLLLSPGALQLVRKGSAVSWHFWVSSDQVCNTHLGCACSFVYFQCKRSRVLWMGFEVSPSIGFHLGATSKLSDFGQVSYSF